MNPNIDATIIELDLPKISGTYPTLEEYTQFLNNMDGQGPVLDAIIRGAHNQYAILNHDHLNAVLAFVNEVNFNCPAKQFEAVTSLMYTLHGKDKPLPIHDREYVGAVEVKQGSIEKHTRDLYGICQKYSSILTEQVDVRVSTLGCVTVDLDGAKRRLKDSNIVGRGDTILFYSATQQEIEQFIPDYINKCLVTCGTTRHIAVFENVKENRPIATPILKYLMELAEEPKEAMHPNVA